MCVSNWSNWSMHQSMCVSALAFGWCHLWHKQKGGRHSSELEGQTCDFPLPQWLPTSRFLSSLVSTFYFVCESQTKMEGSWGGLIPIAYTGNCSYIFTQYARWITQYVGVFLAQKWLPLLKYLRYPLWSMFFCFPWFFNCVCYLNFNPEAGQKIK